MIEQPPQCVVCVSRPAVSKSACCGGCFARIHGDLATVGWAYVHLGDELAALPPATREGSRQHSSESRPPLSVDLVDVRVSIAENLLAWAAYICAEHEPPIPGPEADDVVTAVRWMLACTLRWVTAQPWAVEFADDLGAHRRAAYGAAPWERVRIDLSAPCPGCGLLTLSTYPGDLAAVCRHRSCGEQVPIATMRETKRWTRKAKGATKAAAARKRAA